VVRFGWTYDQFCLQGDDIGTYWGPPDCVSWGHPTNWTHIKLVVNGNQLYAYVGSSLAMQKTTPYTYTPGYITLDLWRGYGFVDGWFDNIRLYSP